jgi:hypothetical protein
VAETTWAEALVPWVDAAGRLAANFAVVGIFVFLALFFVAAVFGSARKQRERRALRPSGSGALRAGRALRILIRPLVRRIELRKFQKEVKGGDGWSL